MDFGHKLTDAMLESIEDEIKATYKQAYADMAKKERAFFERSEELDLIKRRELKDGRITAQQYKDWQMGQLRMGKRYDAFLQEYSDELYEIDRTMSGIINGWMPEVFAQNANYMQYAMGQKLGLKLNMAQYNKETVLRLITKNPDLLPKVKIDERKQIRWNKKLINRQITQGILQGESIPKIAKRMQTVVGMNREQAVRNARSMITGAENAGRLEVMRECDEELGIKTKKVWVATIDKRTRDAHALLDGQTVDYDEPFHSINGDIDYPGDPNADPADYYNCRCTVRYEWAGKPKGAAEMARFSSAEYSAWKKDAEERVRSKSWM